MVSITKVLIFSLFLALTGNQSVAQNSSYKYVEKNTMEGTKLGVFDSKLNKEILPPIYDNILDFSNGKFVVMKAGKVGIVDTLNKIIIPISYEETTGFVSDRVFVFQNKKWAMLNETGVAMTAFLYDFILGYQDGVARVEIAGKTGYIDKFGKQILQCKFTKGDDCNNGFIVVYEKTFTSTGYEYVTKDIKGTVVNTQDIGYSGELPIVFNTSGKIVYKGLQGEEIEFNNSGETFVVKGAPSRSKTAHKIINKNGTELIPYSSGYEFVVRKEWMKIVVYAGINISGEGIVDFQGNIVLKPNFSSISKYEFKENELAKVFFNNGAFFFIDKGAKCVEFEGIKCPE